MMKRLLKLWWIPVALVLVGTMGFVVWAQDTPVPMDEALAALKSDEQVTVTWDTRQDWLVFEPVDGKKSTGLVFYPGGKVDPRSYAPFAHALAHKGFLVVIPVMPLNLAVFSPNMAAEVITEFYQVERWVVGGHSLGGAMAASYLGTKPREVTGLLLVAAYAANDLSARKDLAVLSVFGTLDGLTTGEKIRESEQLLPSDTTYYPVEGGNHAQFGWYDVQAGDKPASISREDQQAALISAAEKFMNGLDE